MIRTSVGALLGWLAGLALTVGLLVTTERVLRVVTAPKVFEMEYGVVYLTLVLGAGFGMLAGALVGLAGPRRPGPRERGERGGEPAHPEASNPDPSGS